MLLLSVVVFFFFNDTATTEIYTLSLHDALPISDRGPQCGHGRICLARCDRFQDRKSTRLNSSHTVISYAVFCLKKKNKNTHQHATTSQQNLHLTQNKNHNRT